MKYHVLILNERVKSLQDHLGKLITILETNEEFTEVEITIDDSSDILSILHAGVMCGANKYQW